MVQTWDCMETVKTALKADLFLPAITDWRYVMPTEFVGNNTALLSSVPAATVECVELLLLLAPRFFCTLRKQELRLQCSSLQVFRHSLNNLTKMNSYYPHGSYFSFLGNQIGQNKIALLVTSEIC